MIYTGRCGSTESVLFISVPGGLVEKPGRPVLVFSHEPVTLPVHICESNWKSLKVFGKEQ